MLQPRTVLSAILLFGVATVAHCQQPWVREEGIVFVAPASGDVRLVVTGTEGAIARAGLPLRVAVADWATGDVFEDIRSQELHWRGGWRLAQRVLAYQQACPGGKVYLVGHSGGNAVVLAAAYWLPPNSIERIVLLSPGVSSHYDLRCALNVSRAGIDHFFSRDDALGSGIVDTFGTNDGYRTRSAGEIGFTPVVTSPMDAALYLRLRQYPCRAEYAAHGYYGGHFGGATRTFLSYALIPMLMAP